jgi:hypothetical protein
METNETSQPTLVNHAIKFGGILAAISVVCVLLIYAIDYTIMAGFTFLLIILVVGIGFTIYAGINYRASIGGYIPYSKAYLHGFMILAISGIISTLFNIVLYKVIDPDLAQNLTEAIITNTEATMARFGAPQESIDEAIDKMRVEMPENFTVMGLLWGYCKALIWYAILALITALVVRKNQPEAM